MEISMNLNNLRYGEPITGPNAFFHPSVSKWHKWLIENFVPNEKIVLITPCSKKKPYPTTSQSGKIRRILEKLKMWNPRAHGYKGNAVGIQWIYLSDLLVIVPYEKATEHPACCYEYPPDYIMNNPVIHEQYIRILGKILSKFGDTTIVTYLPRKHKDMLKKAIESHGLNIDMISVKYNIFYGIRNLYKTLEQLQATKTSIHKSN